MRIIRRSRVVVVVAVAMVAGAAAAWAANSFAVVSPGMAGTAQKLVATLDPVGGGAAYVESARPVGATHYQATFWLDPTGIAMTPGGSAVRFMNLVDENVDGSEPYGGVIAVGFVRLGSDGLWRISFWNYVDTGAYADAQTAVELGSEFPVEVKIEFWRGGAGQTTWCAERTADAASRRCASHLAMAAADVDGLRLGLFANGNPGGWTGQLAYDEVRSSWE